jgi:hypothetical protein
MKDRERAKLQVAAVVGALFGIVTGYVVGAKWIGILLCALTGAVNGTPVTCYVVGGGLFAILIWALIGAVVFSGGVYCLRAFR